MQCSFHDQPLNILSAVISVTAISSRFTDLCCYICSPNIKREKVRYGKIVSHSQPYGPGLSEKITAAMISINLNSEHRQRNGLPSTPIIWRADKEVVPCWTCQLYSLTSPTSLLLNMIWYIYSCPCHHLLNLKLKWCAYYMHPQASHDLGMNSHKASELDLLLKIRGG